jgi:hypothetical protein
MTKKIKLDSDGDPIIEVEIPSTVERVNGVTVFKGFQHTDEKADLIKRAKEAMMAKQKKRK